MRRKWRNNTAERQYRQRGGHSPVGQVPVCWNSYFQLDFLIHIQGVSGGKVNILGGGSIDYSE